MTQVPVSKKKAPSAAGEVTASQLALFTTVIDSNFSNAIALYDMMPKYVYQKKTAFRESELPPEKHVIERTFTARLGRETQRCFLRIKPAMIMKEDDEGRPQRWYIYPGHREYLVEEAIRKIAIENGGHLADGRVGCRFSIRSVQRILADTGHQCKHSDIIQAINVLNQCHMEYGFYEDNGRTKVSGRSALFPEIYLRTRDEYRNGEAETAVRFHDMVNKSIRDQSFRNYDFLTCMTYRLPLSSYLHKRLSLRFTQADTTNYFSFHLLNLMGEGGFNLSPALAKNIEQMKDALEELKAADVVSAYEYDHIKDDADRRKNVDAAFRIFVTERFVSQMIKINSHSKKIAAGVQDE